MTSLRKRRRRRRRYYMRKGEMRMEWIGKMKEAINATYLDEKWRDYFHNIVDRAVERGASERETARKVWLAMNVIHRRRHEFQSWKEDREQWKEMNDQLWARVRELEHELKKARGGHEKG